VRKKGKSEDEDAREEQDVVTLDGGSCAARRDGGLRGEWRRHGDGSQPLSWLLLSMSFKIEDEDVCVRVVGRSEVCVQCGCE